MTTPTFTKEQLATIGAWDGVMQPALGRLAAFALALMAKRDEARRELAEARQYGPKWLPSEEKIEDGWEETEFCDNDFSNVLIFVVPPTPSGRRTLARKEGA